MTRLWRAVKDRPLVRRSLIAVGLAACIEGAIIIAIATQTTPRPSVEQHFGALISPDGSRTWGYASGWHRGRATLRLWTYPSSVIDRTTSHDRKGDWAIIPLQDVEYSKLLMVDALGRSADGVLDKYLTGGCEQSPRAAFPSWTRASHMADASESPFFRGMQWLTEIGMGWPFICCTCQVETRGGTPQAKVIYHNAFAWQSDGVDRAIPVRIYVPGMLGDLALFAPILLLLIWYHPLWMRRVFRRYHGCCESCNYDLRGNTSGVCPECGAAIAPRAMT